MTTATDIINTLAGKTKTLGYDAVIAYDRDKINHLLEQQYVSRRADGTHLPPLSWTNSDATLQFSELTLSAPKISFENSDITDSRVSVTMDFISGSIAKLNSDSQVTRYTRIRPGMGFYLKLDVELKKGAGSVSEQGQVLIEFAAGSVHTTNVDDDPAEEVIPYFQQWLKDNPVTYSVGRLDMSSLKTVLTPTDFIIRTQPRPDTGKETGRGAVLLFVLTTAHPAENVTSLPDASYPWLIPDEYSSVILLNNRLIMTSFIKTAMDKILDTGEWVLGHGSDTADDGAWVLKASDDATLRRDYVYLQTQGEVSQTWSGDFTGLSTPKYEDFIYKLKGVRLACNSSGLKLNTDTASSFVNHFAGIFFNCDIEKCGHVPLGSDITFSLSASNEYTLEVAPDNELIHVNQGDGNVVLDSDYDSKLGNFVSEYEGPSLAQQLYNHLYTSLNTTLQNLLNSVKFDAVNVFAVNHLLFPEQNVNRIKAAFMPGDMVVFGDITASLTSLNVTPLTGTVAAGQSLQFRAGAGVTWSLSPEDAGSISDTGLYQAPPVIDSALVNVKITATGSDGATSSAYVAVVPLPAMISPAFVALKEVTGSPSAQQFAATLTDGSALSGWSVSPGTSGGLTGTIDKDGLYTTPSDTYPKGYSWVTVSATTTDGRVASAQVLLISYMTKPEFPVTPPLLTGMALASTQDFSASGDGYIDPDTWALYPTAETGSLGDPAVSGTDDEPVYTVTYTSPDTVSQDELVIVTVRSEDAATRAGYAVVDVANKKPSAWSRLEGLSVLKVTNEAGAGTAQLYKNGLNQAVIRVQMEGFRTSAEGVPEYISVSLDEILPHLELVDYTSGDVIPRDSVTGWTYSTRENDYSRLPVSVSGPGEPLQASDSYTLYVTCSPDSAASSKKIAVRITMPDGSIISTAFGASSGFDSSVMVNAMEAIIYSASSGINLVTRGAPITKKQIPWSSHDTSSTTYVDRDDKCDIQIAQFYIRPTASGIDTFKNVSFNSDILSDGDVSLFQTEWKSGPEFVFECLDTSVTPCAALGLSKKDRKEDSVNIWFTGESAKLNAGQIYFSSEDQTTIYRVDIPKFSESVITKEACLTLLKVKIPDTVKPYKWNNNSLTPRLTVTDKYGNSGTMAFSWDDGSYYNTPHME
ncbi:hypothetical protein IFU37_022855 (plasmid) [Pantoea agglomerans]|uniref:hypothetical protein n=1 Tax=Enterobacter agglomerans TaxID=549 RepID=UPI002ED1BE1B|nr:hypothetical protein IFU37_022855 [Pantoea agglomerans]